MRLLSCIAGLMLLGSLVGCSGSGDPLGQVSGVITIDGQPVKNGSIEFVPAAGGRPSLALSDESGQFTAYYLPGQPGALIGKHRIRFEIARAQPGDPGLELPPRFGKSNASVRIEPEEIDVQDGVNEINFQLVEG